jgi:predicted nucleic acid binding AN1-type Zn finger protein
MKCSYMGCCNRTSIIGQCKSCEKVYCLSHRLPEKHNCEKINELISGQRKILESKIYEYASKDNKLRI